MTHAATGPRTGPRRGIVYGFNVRDPQTGIVYLGYVGQTRQLLRAREAQHRTDQSWADIIDGGAFVLEEGVWSDGELDRREVAAIQRLRPLFNIAGNEANPDRIPPWEAVAARHLRDDAAGRPRWVAPPKDRPRPGKRQEIPTPAQLGMTRRPVRRPIPLGVVAAAWVGMFVAGMGAASWAGIPENVAGWLAIAVASAMWGRFVVPAWWHRRR
ncbi:hypothetical protein [Catenuloplanes indicus]|uniref:Uncharacterized protein n=1 Tax=Catenuloplanes indicus TaxID=137267 RepID=A0AAE4B2G5_9ACTN|nr:hypothetical protein [Catenuloplanes indicus]MDQ0371642.1 hypothetical protein [Catenuloplanes indicus]